jgi:hypothetical protein
VEDAILAKLCVLMRPYLALEGDKVVREGEVGEEIFIMIQGSLKLQSEGFPRYAHRNWSVLLLLLLLLLLPLPRS